MEELHELKSRMEQERPARWEELPDLALYMDQIVSYMPRQLIHFDQGETLTSAMVEQLISKDGLVPPGPTASCYGPVHLGHISPPLCAPEKGACPCGTIRRAGVRRTSRRDKDNETLVITIFCAALARVPDGPGPGHWTTTPKRGDPAPDGPGPVPLRSYARPSWPAPAILDDPPAV